MKLGPLLRVARKRQLLTLAQLANRVSLSHSYLSRVEASDKEPNPSPEVLLKLARALKLPVDDVFQASGRVPLDLERWIVKTPGMVAKLRLMQKEK